MTEQMGAPAPDKMEKKEKNKGEKLIIKNADGEAIYRITGKTIDGDISCQKDGKEYFLRYPIAGRTALLENVEEKDHVEPVGVEIDNITIE